MRKDHGRPYVTLHSLCSIDGRIKSTRWALKNAVELFEGPAAKIKVDAWIVGRVTMEEFASHKPYKKRRGTFAIPKTDFIGAHKTKTYAVAIDPLGKCHWDTNMVTTEHVIEVLTEAVSGEYLDHLRSKNVSYIFAGKKSIDLKVALQKLRKLFGIKRVRVDGGGKVNGSFLKAGLIDEISLLIVPRADGSLETPTVFDAEVGHTKRRATKVALKSVKRLPQSVLWLRYLVER